MSALSIQFWLLPLVLLLYFVIPEKSRTLRKLLLLFAGLALYISWKPVSVVFLLWVATITYCGGIILSKKPSRPLIWAFALLTLAPLLYFKLHPVIALSASLYFPIGISFYTLQALGYLFDVYRKRIEPVQDALDYCLFVSFFPQLSSGPIGRANHLVPQLSAASRPLAYDISTGIQMIVWGNVLKLVVADRLGLSVDAIYGNYLYYSGADCLLAVVLYSFQIYADFSGYSLIAIGIARCFGIRLADNFRQPYLAIGIGDFWRRWHISLSQWLRDYVYIPLGGSRCSQLRCYANILITFLISGFWHGMAWPFILWGLYLGIGSSVEKAFKLNRFVESHPRSKWLFRFLTFCAITFSWILFRAPSLSFVSGLLTHISTSFGEIVLPDIGGATIFMWVLGLFLVIARDLFIEFEPLKHPIHPAWISIECAILIAVILTFGVMDGGQFIYVNF